MRLALFEPDIPQNTATLLRLAACFDIAVDIIEPCGFLFSDAGFRRAGMDYLAATRIERHASWEHYCATQRAGRLVLLTTKASLAYTDFRFEPADTILLGRESAGVPDAVHQAAQIRLCIPLKTGMRSLNVAVAGAMVLGEALRQTNLFPQEAAA
jgi:tRNA (cytidine/uridine-2'-O-)-methyltransferase